ncbi:MAG: HEAT repeat domain-containing protein [Planctomycetia bacterium]|nr:HEAT repeat domain-containing protein [Planctomycetia bacterium]
MADTQRPISADDALPPVEPPSAAFLVQLFLVPGLIVAIIVCVWLAFHWLAHLGNDPQAYVRTLQRDNEGRWQAALNLANDLRGPGAAGLKQDAALARELGRILGEEAASGRSGEQTETLRLYLCRALGEFAVPEAAPPLVERAAAASDPQTARAAVEALSVLQTNLAAAGRSLADPEAAVNAVLACSRSDDVPLKSAAAFTLGVLGGEAARDRLRALAGDTADDVRFNAALGLARQGSPDAYEGLGEMLGLADVAAAPGDAAAAQSRRYKRALVVVNALRGVAMVVDATREPPPAAIVDRVRAVEADPVGDVRAGARALLEKIGRLASPAAA